MHIMVVGRKERGDIKLNDTAKWLRYRGRIQDRKLAVFSDRENPRRRDVFPPTNGDLPENAEVRYLGRTYRAELSFRAGRGGSRIPVYTWTVQNSAV